MNQQTQAAYWLETRWQISKAAVELFTAQLELLNALGTYESLNIDSEAEARRDDSELIAYFPDQADLKAFEAGLKRLQTQAVTLQFLQRIPRGDWATAWKKHFKPFFLTSEIVIRPSWESYALAGSEKVVTLDPGMAFGTGQHDTTRFCAEFLCEIRRRYPQKRSLLDIGCGSGILSLIGKTIGFAFVTGVDVDSAAVETAQENLGRNPRLAPVSFYLTRGDLQESVLLPSDVVVSNIIAETLCGLKGKLLGLLNPGGLLILSGILPEREESVKSAFADLELWEIKTSPHWHAYLYHKK